MSAECPEAAAASWELPASAGRPCPARSRLIRHSVAAAARALVAAEGTSSAPVQFGSSGAGTGRGARGGGGGSLVGPGAVWVVGSGDRERREGGRRRRLRLAPGHRLGRAPVGAALA